VDTTLAAALVGAIVSIGGVVVGWWLGAYEQRRSRKEKIAALSGALLMETHAAAWHILNTKEALERWVEEDALPKLSFLEIYLPSSLSIYASAGHEVAELGARAAQALVEFHTHLDRTLERTRRICALDGRRVRKDVRLTSLAHCISDWGYVAWAGAQCMDALLLQAKSSLTHEQLESVTSYIDFLYSARSGKRWSLPVDPISLGPNEQIEIEEGDLDGQV
jgi:hypothetical protein